MGVHLDARLGHGVPPKPIDDSPYLHQGAGITPAVHRFAGHATQSAE